MIATVLSRVGIGVAANTPIGLDVAPRAVRAAQLQRTGGRWSVRALGHWDRREDEQGDRAPDGYARRIRRAMDQADFRGFRAAAGLSAPDIEFHMLEVPERGGLEDPQKFAEAVRWELNRVTSVPEGRALSDFWRVPTSSAARTSAIGVVAHGASVDSASHLIESIGLDCERVDTTACALVRLGSMVRNRPGVDAGGIWAVLDVGERMSRLVIAVDDRPVLVRGIGSGGHGWSEAIAKALGVSFDAAEIHKCDHGIAIHGEGASEAPSVADNVAELIFNSLRTDLDAAAGEIERSYEYVLRCYPDRNPGELLLVGGGCTMKGLAKHLAERLGIVVDRLSGIVAGADPVLSVAPHQRGSIDAFACAMGLSLDPEMAS
ncbi:MAG: pilus assembly protein PilM [Phycisphaerales bacterium]|nr:pilus assembly protein PilM [Phycisphaerales bacterium]